MALARCRFAPAYERTSDPNQTRYRGLIVTRNGSGIIADRAYDPVQTNMNRKVFECPHGHKHVKEALECAWQARITQGYSMTDPIAWERSPAKEPA